MASSRTQSPHSTTSNSANNNNTPSLPVASISDRISVQEKRPAPIIHPFDYMNSKEEIEKFKKYEADYTRRLKAKYFSDKDIFGGNIYEEKTTIDGHTYKASKYPGTKSYVDPVKFLEDQSRGVSTSLVQTPTSTSNGMH